MRARNREINIFNMSLLDILCGALGAFCFMMIVLLPYYKPGTGEDVKKQQELDETLKDIDKLKEKLKDAELARELAELIKKLEAQIRELQGRVNSLAAENQNLQGQVKDLTKKIAELESQKKELEKQVDDLLEREPFTVHLTLARTLDPEYRGKIHLYLWQDIQTTKGGRQPAFDPLKEEYQIFWQGEYTYFVTGRSPYANWTVRNVRPGTSWKAYARLEIWRPDPTDPNKRIPAPIPAPQPILAGLSNFGLITGIPNPVLTAERRWVLLGFITADKADSSNITFREATAAEREAEWKALEKAPPPFPPPPRPAPPPSPSPAPSPSPTPSPSRGGTR